MWNSGCSIPLQDNRYMPLDIELVKEMPFNEVYSQYGSKNKTVFDKMAKIVNDNNKLLSDYKEQLKIEAANEALTDYYNQMTESECINGFCPYYGKKKPLKQGYVFQCLWDDLGMNCPCDWELPEEI